MINYVCVLLCFIFFCGGEKPRVCVEKASRSTLVDVRSYAQIGIAIVLTNTDWVVYGEPMHVTRDRLD